MVLARNLEQLLSAEIRNRLRFKLRDQSVYLETEMLSLCRRFPNIPPGEIKSLLIRECRQLGLRPR